MKQHISLIVLLVICSQFSFSQSKKGNCDPLNESQKVIFQSCKDSILKLKKSYTPLAEKYKEVTDTIKNLSKKINDHSIKEISNRYEEQKKLYPKLDSLYQRFEKIQGFCAQNNCVKDSLKTWFSFSKPEAIVIPEKETIEVPDVYIYFGDDEVIKDSIVDTGTIEGKIFYEVLKNKGENNYIGDITVPKENQELHFYKYKVKKDQEGKIKRDEKGIFERAFKNREEDTSTYKLEKIEFEIKDGIFDDIKAHVKFKGETHIFQNIVGLSMLNFHKKANKRHLYYHQSFREQSKSSIEDLEKKFIPIGDVLTYNYAIGNNYIPHDLVLKFPIKDKNGNATNKDKAATYQIKQETYLDKILELRVYTDFLSVFGDNPNGLVQVEGNAKFYVLPFPFRIFGNQMQLFPELYTNVQYSRFDNENRYATPVAGSFENIELDLIEKRFLNMGIEANLISFSPRNNPLKLNFRGLLDYQLTEMELGTDDIQNVKSLATGLGVGLEVSRFNNFAFSFKADWTWHNFADFNTFDANTVNLPSGVPVFRNQAEISYHPNTNPNQAIFVRLNTFNYRGSARNTAFYQFQFGYKFSIGARTVNKKAE